ncbi:hypothetical protein NPIL_568981 [Nephila pilipes]|uniref:Uncharacterized protein n=1 Tax=Nephila pilipes TaxID=299642 RepID=A0A8X6UB24_NEPPI|nr:hypothetical protein NPIL_568981 [Nephila pilipes]
MIEIKTLVEDSDIFKTDPEFVRGIIKSIAEDQKFKTDEEQSKLEFERARLVRLEKRLELEKLRLQTASENVDNNVFTDTEYPGNNCENLIYGTRNC